MKFAALFSAGLKEWGRSPIYLLIKTLPKSQ
jgi:hypothetical protein